MLSLSASSSPSGRMTVPHIVPFRVNHTGPTSITERYWNPRTPSQSTDSATHSEVAYFRGRKLIGRKVPISDGYRGAVVKVTDRHVEVAAGSSSGPDQEHDEKDEVDDEPQESTRAMEELASFDAVMVWEHEARPGDDHPAVRGLQEWTRLAEAIHAYDGVPINTATGAQ